MDWTEETIVRLRGLWADGHSTAEIGRRLGVTKNAVVGKAHRLDLPARPSPIRRGGPSGTQPRRAAPRRLAGPTLPPLGSISPSLATGSLAATSLAPAQPSSVVAHPPEASLPDLQQAGGTPRPQPGLAELPRAAPLAAAPAAMRGLSTPRPYARSLTCCWPIGEPGTKSFRFCDDGATAGKPYCAQHAAIAYVRVRDRREDAA